MHIPSWLPEGYRERLEDFYEKLTRETYLQGSGQKEELRIAALYGEYADLYGEALVLRFQDIHERSMPQRAFVFPSRLPEDRESRSLDFFLNFAMDCRFNQASAPDIEALETAKSAARVKNGDEESSFYGSAVRMAREPSAQKRRGWHAARLEAIRGFEPLCRRRWETCWEEARRLGCGSYARLWSRVLGVDYRALEARLADALRKTDSLYEELLGGQAARIGMELSGLSTCDMPYLLNFSHRAGSFAPENLVASVRRTLAGMGIDLASQKNVVMDMESRPGKSSRAFCAPIRVPREVALVLSPSGGASDYSTLFHEMGHTQHFAWTSENLPAEFRVLGDRALTEGYAFLLQYLVQASPSWAGEMLGITDASYFEETALASLYYMRRYAAKLRYENVLHEKGEADSAMPGFYRKCLEEATRLQTPPDAFLDDVDESFYSADYLRAWLFEAYLRDALLTRFGTRWWSSPKAGDFLREMWRSGGEFRAEEMAREIGARDLSPDAWEHNLRGQLRLAREGTHA
jgi:hypothetical protein